MDSEALLPDQTKDGEKNSMQIVEEKTIVNEKHLNGEGLEHKNAAIAEVVQNATEVNHGDISDSGVSISPKTYVHRESKDLHESVETESEAANDQAVPESVLDCSKTPSSASEKEDRSEEVIKEVDSCSVAVDVSSTEESTNKRIEIIEDEIEGFEGKNGELERPLDTANPAKKVTATNGKLEAFPVESDSANLAGDAEEAADLDDKFAISSREAAVEVEEQAVVTSTETSSATSVITTVEEAKDLEAKSSDLNKEVGVHVEDQVATESDSVTLAILNAEETREAEVANDNHESTANVEEQVPTESNSATSTVEVAEKTREREAKFEDEKEVYSAVGNVEENREAELAVDNHEMTTNVEEQVSTESIFAPSAAAVVEETRETKSKLEDGKELPSVIVNAEGTTEVEAELTDNQETMINIGEHVPAESILATSVGAVAQETREIEAKFENESDVSSTIVNAEGTIEEEAELIDGSHETTTNVEEQVPTESIFATSTIAIAEETTAIEAKLEDEKKVSSTIANVEGIAEAEAELTNGRYETTTNAEEHVPTESIFAASVGTIAQETREIEAKLEDEKEASPTIFNAEVESQLTDENREATINVEEQIPTESIFATSAIAVSEEMREIEAKLEDENEVSSTIVNAEGSTEVEVGLTDGNHETTTNIEEHVPTESIFVASAVAVAETTREIEAILEEEKKGFSRIVNTEGATEAEVELTDDNHETTAHVGEHIPTEPFFATSVGPIAQETREIEAKFEDESNVSSTIVNTEGTTEAEAELTDDNHEAMTNVEEQVPTESIFVTSTTEVAEETREKEAKLEDEKGVSSSIVDTRETKEAEAEFTGDIQKITTNVEEHGPTESTFATSDIAVVEETREMETNLEDEKEVGTEANLQVPIDSCGATSAIGTANGIVELKAKIADSIEVAANEVGKQVPIESVVDSSSAEIVEESKETQDRVEQQVSSDSGIATSAIGPFEETKEKEFAVDDHKVPTDVEKQTLNEPSDATLAISITEEGRETEAKIEEDGKKEATEIEEIDSSNYITSDAGVAEETEGLVGDHQKVPTSGDKQIQADETTDIAAKTEDANTEVEHQFSSDFTSSASALGVAEKTEEIAAKFADNTKKLITEAEKHVATETGGISLAIVTGDKDRNSEVKIVDEEKEATIEVQQVPSDSSTSASANEIAEETEGLKSKLIEDDGEVPAEVEKQVRSKESTDLGVELGDGKTKIETGAKLDNCKTGIETQVEQQLPSDSTSPTSTTAVTEKFGGIEAELAVNNQEVITESENQIEIATEISDVSLAVVTADEAGHNEDKIVDDEKETAIEVQEQVPIDSSTSASVNGISEETERLESKHIDDDREVPTGDEKQVPNVDSTEVGAKFDNGITEVETEVEQQFPSDSTSTTSAIGIAEKSIEIETELTNDKQEVITEVEKQVASETTNATLTAVTAGEFRLIEDDEKEAAVEVQEQVPNDSSTSNEFDKFVDDEKKTTIEDEAQVPSDFSTCASANKTSEEIERLEFKHIDDDQEVPAEAEKQVPRDDSTDVETKIDDGEIEIVSEVEPQLPSDFTGPISIIGIAEKSIDIEAELADEKKKEKTEVEKQVASETSDVTLSAVTAEEFRQIEDDEKEAILEIQEQVPSDSSTSNEFKKIYDDEKQAAMEVHEQVPSNSSTSNEFCKFADDEKETAIEDQEQVLSDSSTCASANGIPEETERLESKHIDDDPEVLAEAEKQVSRGESTDVDNVETEVEKQLPSDYSSPTSAIGVAEKSIEIEAELADDKQEEKTEAEKQVASETSDVTLAVVTAEEFRQIEDDEKEAAVEVQEQVPSDFSTSNEFEKIEDEAKELAVADQEQVPSDSITFASASEILEETEGMKSKCINDDQEVPIEAEKQVPSNKSIEVGATLDDGESKVEAEAEQQFPSDSTSPTSVIGIAKKSVEIVEIEAELAGDKLEVKTEAEKQLTSEYNDVYLAGVIDEEFSQIEDGEKEAAVNVQEQVPSDFSTFNEFSKFIDYEKKTTIEDEAQVLSDSSTCASANRISEETERLGSKHMDDDQEVLAEAENPVSRDESTDIDNGETEGESAVEQQLPSDFSSPTSAIGIAEKSIEIETELAHDKQEDKTEAEKQIASETSDGTLSVVTAEAFRQIEDDEKEAAVEVQEQDPSDSSTSNEFGNIEDKEKEAAVDVQEQVPSDSITFASAIGILEEAEGLEYKHINEDQEEPIEAEKQVPSNKSIEVGSTLDDGDTKIETEVEQQFSSDSTSPTSAIGIAEKSVEIVEIEAEVAGDKLEVKTEAEKQLTSECNDVYLAAVVDEEFSQIEDGEKEATVNVQEQVPSDFSTCNEFSKFIDDEKKTTIEGEAQVLSDSSTCASANGISEETGGLGSKHIDDDQEVSAEAEKQVPRDDSTDVEAKIDDGETEVESEVEQQLPSDFTSLISTIRIAKKSIDIEAELTDDKQKEKTEAEKQVASETSDVTFSAVTAEEFRQIEDDRKEAILEVQEQVPSDYITSNEFKKINDEEKEGESAVEQQLPSDFSSPTSVIGIAEKSIEIETELAHDKQEEKTEAEKQVASETSDGTLSAVTAEAFRQIEDDEKEAAVEVQEQVPSDSSTSNEFGKIEDNEKEAAVDVQEQVPSDSITFDSASGILEETGGLEYKHINDDQEEPIEAEKEVPCNKSIEVGTTLDDGETKVETEAEQQFSSDSTSPTSAIGIAEKSVEIVEIEAELAGDKLEVKTEAEKQLASEYNDVNLGAVIDAEFRQIDDDEKEAAMDVHEQVPSDFSTSNEFSKFIDDEKKATIEDEAQVLSDSSTCVSANGISEETERLNSKDIDDDQEVPIEAEKQVQSDKSAEGGAKFDNSETEVEQQFPSDSTSPTSTIGIADKSMDIEAELAYDKQEVITESDEQVAIETGDVTSAAIIAKEFRQTEDDEKEAKVEVQEHVASDSSTSNEFKKVADNEKETAAEVEEQAPSDSSTFASAIGISEENERQESGHVDDDSEVPIESEKQIPRDGSEVGATLGDGKTEVETEVEQQFPSDSTSPTSVIRNAEKSVENEAELTDDKQEVKTEAERQVAWETSDVTLAGVTAKAFKQIEDGEKEAAVEVQEQVPSGSHASDSASGISEGTEKLESKHINDDREMPTKAEKQVPSEEFTEVGAKLDDGETEIETEPQQRFPSDSTSPTLAIGIAEKSMDIEADFADDKQEVITEAEKQVANETGDVTLVTITAEAFRQIEDDGKEATFVAQEQVPSDSSTSNEFRKIEDEKESAVEVHEQVPSDSSTSTSARGISDETERLEHKAVGDDQEVFSEAEKQIPRDESTEVGVTLDDGKTDVETAADQQFPSDSTSPTSPIGIAERFIEIEAELADNKQEVKTEVGKQDASETSNVTLVVVAAEGFEQIEDDKKEAEVEVEEQIPSDSSSSNEFGKIVDDEKETTIEVQQEVSSDSTACTSANEIAKETESLQHKLIDDDLGVLAEAEKPIPSEEFIEIETGIETVVEQQFPSDATSVTSAMGITEKSGQIEAELADDKQEVEIKAELADDKQEVEIEAELADDKQEVEIEAELADDKQEEITKAENQVASETSDVTLAVVTVEEFEKTEAKIEDNEKEAAVEVQEQVPNDSSTSTLAYRNSEDTKKLEAELTDEDQVVQMQIEDVKQIPVEDSTEVRTKVEDGRTEVESEVEKQFPRDSISPAAIQTGEETREIEAEPANENQKVITVTEKQVASGSLGFALAVVTTADEVGKTEAKIEDDEKEAAGKVQEQVQSDFAISTSADKIVEETIKLEPNLTDEDQVVLTEDVKQIPVEDSTDIRAKVEDGKAELENEDEIQELITEAENQVATEASDATLADAKAAAKEVPSDSSISTSADRIYEEAKNLEPKLIDEDRMLLTEAEKQIAIEEFAKIGAKVEDGKAEVESEVEQQFPSDSGTPTSAIGIAVKAREIEAELADENWEMPREVASEINDSTSVICSSDDVRETKTKIEGDEEVVTEVGEQISINSSTSADGTTEDAKEPVAKLADDNQETAADVGEQGLTESRSDISAAESAEESRKTEAELVDEKQEAAPEVKKQELNQRNEADAANDIGQVLAEEERDNATFDDTSDNANDNKLKIVDLVKEDGDNNHTSIVQTAGEISQATVEAKNEKQDEITQIEEPSVAEINKIDSGCLIAGLSTREEKPNVIIESVDKEEDILEYNASMDDLNDANVISQVPESTVDEVKDCGNDKMVREIDDHSQTVVKDMDIEMKEDTITLVESSNNLYNGTETDDGFEGKKRSEGLEIVEHKKEDILKVDKVILDENFPDTTESLTKIEKSPVVVEVIEQNDGEKCEDSANKNITTDETDKSAGEEGDASNNLPMENKISEGNEEKETKDENVQGTYDKGAKDIDVSKEVAIAVTAFDESLSPKSADFVKVEEVPKESAPAKPSPRRSNNIISKVKHQIVKAKKAIMGKSSSPKDIAPKSNELK